MWHTTHVSPCDVKPQPSGLSFPAPISAHPPSPWRDHALQMLRKSATAEKSVIFHFFILFTQNLKSMLFATNAVDQKFYQDLSSDAAVSAFQSLTFHFQLLLLLVPSYAVSNQQNVGKNASSHLTRFLKYHVWWRDATHFIITSISERLRPSLWLSCFCCCWRCMDAAPTCQSSLPDPLVSSGSHFPLMHG